MSQLFKNQSLLTITLETGIDLSTASVTRILFEKPNKKRGFFTASVSGTALVYVVQNNDFDMEGEWKLQAYAEIAGKKAFGQIVNYKFLNTLN